MAFRKLARLRLSPWVRRDWADARVFAFPRAQFMVGGALPTPAV